MNTMNTFRCSVCNTDFERVSAVDDSTVCYSCALRSHDKLQARSENKPPTEQEVLLSIARSLHALSRIGFYMMPNPPKNLVSELEELIGNARI